MRRVLHVSGIYGAVQSWFQVQGEQAVCVSTREDSPIKRVTFYGAEIPRARWSPHLRLCHLLYQRVRKKQKELWPKPTMHAATGAVSALFLRRVRGFA